MTHVYGLRIGLDNLVPAGQAPRLRWRIEAPEGGWEQQAAEISLHTEATDLTVVTVVRTDQSVDVRWPFDDAVAVGRHVLQLRAQGTDGLWTPWSAPVPFVVSEGFGSRPPVLLGHPSPTSVAQPLLLRTHFTLPFGVVRARLRSTAQGAYDIEINGRSVSDDVLAGGWTVFDKRLLVREIELDPATLLSENTIGVRLAGGWFTESYGHLGNTTRHYGDQPAFGMRLTITLRSGETIEIDSDASWFVSDGGGLRSSSIYQGELFDARLEVPDWAEPSSGTDGWVPAKTVPTEADFELQTAPPVRGTEELAVVDHWITDEGDVVVDFGQNHAGRVRMRVVGARGHELSIRHAEVLEDGNLAFRPLRFAAAHDTYILRGDADGETLEPRFTFHGYRYARISGWPGAFDPAQVSSIVLRSDLDRTGTFRSSHAQLNRLHENVVWSTKSNFLAIPTDCPQRDERLGWTGDIQVFAATSSFLFDDNAFLQSWLRDLELEQSSRGGRVPVIVPDPINDIRTPAAAWGDAATVVPWTVYERYGDSSVLEKQFASMKAWVDCIRARSSEGLWLGDFQFGDWLDPSAPPQDPGRAMTDPDLVATAYLFRSAAITADVAALLGEESDAVRYRDVADMTHRAFSARFGTKSGLLTSDSPTAYALAIVFGLTDGDEQRIRFGDRLAELTRIGGHRIQTGFVGTPIICDALTSTGHEDDAAKLILQDAQPSWLYPVTMDATTIWERWDSMLPDGSINPGEMTSFNHYALGAVADWLHRRVAGISPAEPGYRVVLVEPIFLRGLDWAEADLDSPYGTISTAWTRSDDGAVDVRLHLPANTTARVRLPGWDDEIIVRSGSHRWTCAGDRLLEAMT